MGHRHRNQQCACALINQLQRRDFIALLGGTAAAWPVSVRAQQPTMALVGLLAGQHLNDRQLDAVRQGLKEAGYIEGRNGTRASPHSSRFCSSMRRGTSRKPSASKFVQPLTTSSTVVCNGIKKDQQLQEYSPR